MNRTLPLLLLLLASPLAASIPFTNAVRTGPAAFSQMQPVLASNGFDYLAAWWTQSTAGTALYTVRIAADGTVAGPLPRLIDPTNSYSLEPGSQPHGVSLTAGRDGYFLAWMSDAGLNTAITDAYGVIERRVTLPQERPGQMSTLAAWNGSVHLVLAFPPSGSTPFTATLFDNNCDVIAAAVPVGDAHGDGMARLNVVADDNGFLILSTKPIAPDRTDLYGRRITPAGVAGEWFLIRSMASTVTGVAAAFDGSSDVIVWGDGLGIWTMPLTTRTDIAGASRQLLSAPVAVLKSVLWTGDRLWIPYDTSAGWESRYLTVSAAGAITPSVKLGAGPAGAVLASNNSRVLAVDGSAYPDDDVTGRFITADAGGSNFLISYSETQQRNGSLATDGTNLLAVWDEAVPPERRIYASLTDPARGVPSAETQVSGSGTGSNPVVAFNGSSYLVVWMRAGEQQQGPPPTQIVARRVSRDGALLDGADILIGEGAEPRVASDGLNWLVVWQRAQPGLGCPFTSGPKLVATRVAPSGSLLDGYGVAIAPDSRNDQRQPDLTWSGSQYVVTWSEQCTAWHQPLDTSISAATMSRDLTGIAAGPVSGRASTSIGTRVDTPKVTATTDRILVAWTSTAGIRYRLFGDRISSVALERQRSAVLKPADAAIAATLIGVGHEPTGQMFILGKMTIPTAPLYQGLHRWNVSESGAATNSGMRFIMYPSEELTGTPLLLGGIWWMADSIFSPSGGAYRLYAHDFK